VAVAGWLTFAAVSAGGAHACRVTTAGAAYCWGLNGSGQLGNGTTTNSPTPVAVSGGLTFTQVSAGAGSAYFTCGVTTAGAAYCWGYNGYGQLGNGTTTTSSTPVAVAGGLTFAAVSAGLYQTCGVTTAGAAYCWGDNGGGGERGNGTFTNSTTPVAVAGGLTFAAVSAGESFNTCGVTTAGTAYCWGLNLYGELGNGSFTISPTPVAVSGGLTFAAVSAGGAHACGVTTAGAAYCWGDKTSGELGNGGTPINTTTPVRVW